MTDDPARRSAAVRIEVDPDPVPRTSNPGVAAAVAIGATSVHFTACAVTGREIQPIADESVLLGLGATVDREGRLPGPARAELVAALVRFSGIAAELGAPDVTLIATEPLRRAADADEVVAEVRLATGHPLYVLSHAEEGYLSLLSVTRGTVPGTELLLVDIGGGSSEYVAAGPGHPPRANGLAIGAARLTDLVVAHDPPTVDEMRELRAEARRYLSAADELAPREVVFVGGTASNLARIIPAAALDRIVTRRRLAAAFATLQQRPAEDTATRFGIHAVRARILPGGAALVEAFLDRYRLRQGRLSESNLREGAIFAVARAGESWRARLAELVGGSSG